MNVRRLSVLERPFALEPSELDAAGCGSGGLGARGGFRFVSPPLPRVVVSTLTEPRLPMTVWPSSSVSSSSVLTPDAELDQNTVQRTGFSFSFFFSRSLRNMWSHDKKNMG